MKFPELSYASPDDPAWKRALIHMIEAMSGRRRFLPLYETWRSEIIPRSPWVMGDLLRLIEVELELRGEKECWPARLDDKAPLVMVANHPFGIGDGIAFLAMAEQLGRPFRVLINKDLLKVPEIKPYSLPIDFSETREAMQANIRTRREALDLLKAGVTIVVFPAGGVATAPRPFAKAVDLPWKTFTARMIQAAKASVLPVYFEGQNGWLFHLVSRLSLTLRLSLLVAEFRRFAGSTCRARVGRVIPFDELKNPNDRKALTDELHTHVHALADRELDIVGRIA